MAKNPQYLSLAELSKAPTAAIDNAISLAMCEMRAFCPGIVQAFDEEEQTLTVRLALRERMIVNQRAADVQMPDLVHVPPVLMRAGGFVITVPFSVGDEVLVGFGDMCIDSWWQSGGVQNQMKLRRHNLSDGFAIVGIWNQRRKVLNYATDSLQIRSEDGTVVIDVSSDGIEINGSAIAFNAAPGGLDMSGDVVIEDNLHVASGASGTFTTPTGQIVTVQDGIVISIA